ncbi:MAG: response regulator, partial [Candidatus Binatia bacterium]
METQQIQAKPPIAEAKRKILIVEDEKDIRGLVRYNLETEGFAVVEASDGEIGLTLAATERPALVILDLMLPGLPGLEVCRLLRVKAETLHVPILILTARAAEVDKILGLEMGADDYVTKPFSPRELVARVKAVLRRAYGPVLDRPHECYE